jgi:hypothetical protein
MLVDAALGPGTPRLGLHSTMVLLLDILSIIHFDLSSISNIPQGMYHMLGHTVLLEPIKVPLFTYVTLEPEDDDNLMTCRSWTQRTPSSRATLSATILPGNASCIQPEQADEPRLLVNNM